MVVDLGAQRILLAQNGQLVKAQGGIVVSDLGRNQPTPRRTADCRRRIARNPEVRDGQRRAESRCPGRRG